MPITSFDSIKQVVLQKLEGLDTRLVYHNVDHTLDVLKHAERIAREENIENERYLYLLKVAALYHDAGFLQIYDGHEEQSCEIFTADAVHFDILEEEKIVVREMIMATKITNEPRTHLEKILRDADLDYLGRRDFDAISNRLKTELLQWGLIADGAEWDARQLAFFKQHRYYTQSSQRLREPVKHNNYRALLT